VADKNKDVEEAAKELPSGTFWNSDNEQTAISNEVRFQEQCFIMMGLFSKHAAFVNPSTYSNFTKVVDNTGGSQVINELTAVKGADELFKITAEELAHLQPFIRFFKVQGSTQTEFPFSRGSFVKSGSTVKSIFQNKTDRGSEVGIQSVDFELLATQPEEITNNIRCNVKLFFQNLNGILKSRTSNGLKYADLIVRPKSADTSLEAYEPEDYRVKLVIGWQIPKSVSVRKELRDALARTRTILNLTLKNHTFNFNMDGTADLDIEYHAWVEGSLSSPKTDLLYPPSSLKSKIKSKSATIASQKSQMDSRDEPTNSQKKNLKKLAMEKATLKKASRGQAYKRILDRIMQGNMYFFDLEPGAVGIIGDEGEDQSTGSDGSRSRSENARIRRAECSERRQVLASRIGGMAAAQRAADPAALSETNVKRMEEIYESHKDDSSEDNASIKEAAMSAQWGLTPQVSPVDPAKVRVHYFFLGDLLEACYDILKGNSEYTNSQISKTLLMTGPIYLNDPCGDSEVNAVGFNIADIPISLNVFQSWFIKKLISPGINNYLLRNLINDVIGELLPAALGNQCTDGAERQLIRAETNPITFKGSKAIPRGGVITVNKAKSLNQVLSFNAAQNKTNTQDCVLLYTSGFSAGWLKGKRAEDIKRGIYHFDIGKSTGIIKNISFSKNDAPYLGEAKVTGTGNIAEDLGGGSIYNFDAELVGNGLFVPGQYVFVNPRALGLGVPGKGDPIASKLRLGGYYAIHKVESTLERGAFSTSISGIWQADGSGKTNKAAVKPT
jgi:hypothetical protein